MSTKPIHSTAATRFDLSAAVLHILAMVLMLMDHLWATLLPAQEWLTCAGRVAFPIFAFMAVEGYFHTHDLKKYTLRLLLFALLSEVPFDLMYGGTWFYPVHQNVIWTLLLGILGIHLMETVRKKQKTALYLLVSALVVVAGAVLGTLGMVDYYGAGVLTVFIFYFFHGRKWWCLLGQLAALYWVNVELLGGLMYPIQLFGMDFELCQQGLALLALVPIWLYRGRQPQQTFPVRLLRLLPRAHAAAGAGAEFREPVRKTERSKGIFTRGIVGRAPARNNQSTRGNHSKCPAGTRPLHKLCAAAFFAGRKDTCSQKVQPSEQKILFFSCKIDNMD